MQLAKLVLWFVSDNVAISLPVRWGVIDAHQCTQHAYIQCCNSVWHQAALATKAGEAKVQKGIQFKCVTTAIAA